MTILRYRETAGPLMQIVKKILQNKQVGLFQASLKCIKMGPNPMETYTKLVAQESSS